MVDWGTLSILTYYIIAFLMISGLLTRVNRHEACLTRNLGQIHLLRATSIRELKRILTTDLIEANLHLIICIVVNFQLLLTK